MHCFNGFHKPIEDLSKDLTTISAELEMELEADDFGELIEADKQP